MHVGQKEKGIKMANSMWVLLGKRLMVDYSLSAICFQDGFKSKNIYNN